MKKIFLITSIAILIIFLAIALGGPVRAQTEGAPGPQFERMQFTGVIKNHTKYDVFFPSNNSGGTIKVPAHGWAEYIIWSPTFDLVGYIHGNMAYCETVQVVPDNFKFGCKTYDFVAEIDAPPCKVKKSFKKKRRHAPRAPKGPEVEGLG
jgi:hypothetical protein